MPDEQLSIKYGLAGMRADQLWKTWLLASDELDGCGSRIAVDITCERLGTARRAFESIVWMDSFDFDEIASPTRSMTSCEIRGQRNRAVRSVQLSARMIA